ncbi:MAG TPA: class I SAM-dependent methyltransferase [Chitinophagaceae bacterium]|nr:class I SAM-dependent methyltransferase [Chitinophagaceae bacterium]
MNVKEAYNIWAAQYDTNENKTRDLEAVSLRQTLSNITTENCLEIGCGTGKNTEWLVQKAKQLTSVDLSEEMLAKAKAKISASNISFIQADITKEWEFPGNAFDLVTFSLVLEHIEDLDDIFKKLSSVTTTNAYVYIGELHPFKQYNGTKARFETEKGLNIVTCFNHNISDFTGAAKKNGFQIIEVAEYFDNNDRAATPRILTLLLKKSWV